MSASSKKKLRKENEAELLTSKQQTEQAEAKKLKKQTTVFVIAIALIVIAFLVLMVIETINTTGIIPRSTTGATVGSEKLNSVELSYYYTDTVQEIVSEWNTTASEYASYAEMTEQETIKMLYGVDLSIPLAEQKENEETGATWADYFMNAALESAQYDFAMAAAAKEAGFTLPADYQTTLDSEKSTLEFWGSYYGSTKSYLVALYGTGANEKSYLEYRERALLAEAYYAHVTEEYAAKTYTADELSAHEEGNELNYNSYDYSYYYLSYTKFQETTTTEDTTEDVTEEGTEETVSDETVTEESVTGETVVDGTVTDETVTGETVTGETVAEETVPEETVAEETVADETGASEETEEETEAIDDDTARAMAKETAEALAQCTTVEELDEAIAALPINAGSTTAASTKAERTLYTSVPAAMREWVSDSARVEGEIAVLPNEATDGTINGYYVVIFEGMTDNTTGMANVRHLLVQFETEGEDSEPTEEQVAAAWTEAEELLATWEAGEKTEESFIELVKEHSDDTSASEGGLFEDINPASSYVENFLNWSIDPDRQVGDCEIVETEYGCHIMYFSGYSERSYRDQMIASEIQKEELTTWQTNLLSAYPTAVKSTKHIDLDAGVITTAE